MLDKDSLIFLMLRFLMCFLMLVEVLFFPTRLKNCFYSFRQD